MSSVKNNAADLGGSSAAFKRRFMIRLVGVLIGGMFIDGFILGIIGTVIVPISKELNFTDLWEGLIAAAALIGILVGSPLAGWAADKYGRKPMFQADMALFCLASVAQFFVDSAWQLFVVRLLMGVAIGAEYSVGWPLMSEFAPARLRGRLISVSEVGWYVGFMVAFLVGYILTTQTDVGWRTILGTSTVIAVILVAARVGLPESPRWLWNVGRREEAMAIAHKYMTDTADMKDVEHEDVREGTFGMLFSRQYWRATLFVSGCWFAAVTPYFAIATFAESVLAGYGISGGLAGGLGLSAVAAAGVVGTVLLVDRVGRRMMTVPPQWVCAVALAVIGLWAGAPPMVVLFLFLVFSFFNANVVAMMGVYPSEIFPTEIRGIGIGFATAVSRVGAGIGTFLLPWSMVHFGSGPTMLVAAGIAAVGAGLSQWLAPETKGMNLSESSAGSVHGRTLVGHSD
ncbi:MFS transporter [Humibacillus sp. DSM 29435]|uniref:MFS transporter n=1 Tax=Humibacillus sp. DSM 29435 TaxID=1869167 RepID=UPI000873264D|nr:MFS transporter [Humibacillus sp. DSM 29435]OFE15568.1 MFS transporter [Humibacillus sp. DSM 29435]